jgi:hypothetical protein
MKGMKGATQCNFYEKHTSNLKGKPYMRPSKGAKHLKPCDKDGGTKKTLSEMAHYRNTNNWIRK